MFNAVDLIVGDTIVVASTDFNARHAEKRTITSIDRTNAAKPVITLSSALTYKHYSNVQNTITTRCEVILLSRSIIIRGDPTTSRSNLLGAHVMIQSHGAEESVGRVKNVEFTDVG